MLKISQTTPNHAFIKLIEGWTEPAHLDCSFPEDFGYNTYAKRFGCEGEYTVVQLGTLVPSVIEVSSLISYPDRKGYGTSIMKSLCEAADQTGSTLWLSVMPYGRNRDHMTVAKLQEFYRRFGFFNIRSVPAGWKTLLNRRFKESLKRPMMRSPVGSELNIDAPQTGIAA